jgi:hypothetical protein
VCSKAAVRSTETCPRCGAPTRQLCAPFIYAADKSIRAMMAPAGFFGSKCPAAIVDEQIIASGWRRNPANATAKPSDRGIAYTTT